MVLAAALPHYCHIRRLAICCYHWLGLEAMTAHLTAADSGVHPAN